MCTFELLPSSDAGGDEEGGTSPTPNAASSSSSSTTSPTSPKGGAELSTSLGAGPGANLTVEQGTHKKKPRDRMHTSPNPIRKKKEVSVLVEYIYIMVNCSTVFEIAKAYV